MNGGAKRVATVPASRTVEPPLDGPLKFDFGATRPVAVAQPQKSSSIKEALLRWLDEQL
jgi:hypothetical protein